MPPYVHTHDRRVQRSACYDVRRPSDGASLGCGFVVRFEPDQMVHVFGKDEYVMPADLKAVVDFRHGSSNGVLRLELPMDWLGERLPDGAQSSAEAGVSTPTWAQLFSNVVTRAGAGIGLTVLEGLAMEQDMNTVRLVWSSGDEATLLIEDGDYEGDGIKTVLTSLDAATVRRRAVLQEELARQKADYGRREEAKRVAAQEAYRLKVEERVRAAWPRFELHRRSDALSPAPRPQPHESAVWNATENRWEVTAASLDALVMNVLGDVPYALHIVPRGKTAPADVLTVVEIVDVELEEES